MKGSRQLLCVKGLAVKEQLWVDTWIGRLNAAAERIWISLQGDGMAPSCDGVAEVGSIHLTKPMYCASLQPSNTNVRDQI